MGHPIPPLDGGASHTARMEPRRRCIPPRVDGAPSVPIPGLPTLGSGTSPRVDRGARRQRSLPPRDRRPPAELKPIKEDVGRHGKGEAMKETMDLLPQNAGFSSEAVMKEALMRGSQRCRDERWETNFIVFCIFLHHEGA